MATRAGVSEREFYEVFHNAEECFSAAFEDGLARLSTAVLKAAGREERWLGRVRSGLVGLLGFLDDEPGWGRLLFLGAPVDGAIALRCERRVLGLFSVLVHDGRPQSIADLAREPQLTAELVVGGIFSVIRARMSEPEGDGRALVELTPSLMAFIGVALTGQAAASAECGGGRATFGPEPTRGGRSAAEFASPWPISVTYRTTLVLNAIADAPRSSNREIAAAAGIVDEGQASHLLRRLAQRGLIEKVNPRGGSRRENAWLLTHSGRRVIELVGPARAAERPASRSASVRQAA